jgi:hypothetical protein
MTVVVDGVPAVGVNAVTGVHPVLDVVSQISYVSALPAGMDAPTQDRVAVVAVVAVTVGSVVNTGKAAVVPCT